MYNLSELKPLIEEVIINSFSMREAASKTKLNFKTFRKYAILFNLYKPNQPGKGGNKFTKGKEYPLEDILSGKYPQYHTYKLGKRLIKENIKEAKCEICNNTNWNNELIPLELDHIDGNPYNHLLTNLRLICPNCHAQTSTYRNKIRKSPACLPISP